MLTSCCRVLLNRIARQPATFLSHFSAHQRFVRTFYLSATSSSEFSTMSEKGEWTNVEKSGKSKKKGKGSQKGNEQKPKPANEATPKSAKGGPPSSAKGSKSEQNATREGSKSADAENCPWLAVVDSDEEVTTAGTAEANAPDKKKRNKKKKNKKNKSEQERDSAPPRAESAGPKSPPLSNGIESDADESEEPKTTESKEGTKASTTEAPTTETEDKNEQDDDDDSAPMSWEDAADDAPLAETRDANKPDDNGVGPRSLEDKSDDATKTGGKESQSAADGEESAVSQASGDATDKDLTSTEDSAGEGSPRKKKAWSDRDKISFTVGKEGGNSRQRSLERLKLDSPKEERGASAGGKQSQPARKSRKDFFPGEKPESGRQRSQHSTDRNQSEASGKDAPWEKKAGKDNAKRPEPGKRDKQDQQKGAAGQGGGRQEKKKKVKVEPFNVPGCEGFEFIMINDDLFNCDFNDAMAHCVSQDLEMGKGIAVEFKRRFHGVGDLRHQNKKVGEVAVLYRDGSYVYYLITKPLFHQKPTYESLTSSLKAMRDHCVENKVPSLAMPQIGCGLDRLDWDHVTDIIKKVFKNTGITVKVFYI